MPQVRKAPVPQFEEYIKKSITNIELIKTKQEEKQAILNEYEKQHSRFADGKISRTAFDVSVKENKKLLGGIDSEIRKSISSSKSALQSALKITSSQVPEKFNLSLEGLTSPARKVIKKIRSGVSHKKSAVPKKSSKPKRSVARRRRR